MVIDVQIDLKSRTHCHAFIDSGALAVGFIDSDFAQSLQLPTQPLKHPRPLDMIDGSESKYGWITRVCHTQMALGAGVHTEDISLFIVPKLPDFPVILGRGWLRRHNPRIDFTTDTLCFDSPQCIAHCPSRQTSAREEEPST
jgi:hypothetical protein